MDQKLIDVLYPRATAWCQYLMDKHFATWLQSKAGKQWKARTVKPSPYTMGFTIREDVSRMIEALNKGDEETIKALLMHYPKGIQ